MSKNFKILLLFFITIILFMFTLISYYNDLNIIKVVLLVSTIISFISMTYIIFYTKTNHDYYKKNIARILRIYNQQIVKMKNNYEIKNKNIVCAKKIEDLFELSIEFKIPVINLEEENGSVFLIEYGEDVLYFIIKKENSELNFEKKIKDLKNKKREQKNNEDKLLSEINKTTIIQMKNNRFYKIKPIKNNNGKKC